MNRSISNVLIGGFGDGAGSGQKKAKKAEGTVKEVSAEDVIEMMLDAKSMIIVPGYGMAVAKAQHAIADLTTKIEELTASSARLNTATLPEHHARLWRGQ